MRDLAAKTKRGLRGRGEAGRSAGGRCYGYRVSRSIGPKAEQARGGREIDVAEAAVACRIFEEFIIGKSPRAIARQLNGEGVAAPMAGPGSAPRSRPCRARHGHRAQHALCRAPGAERPHAPLDAR